METLTSTGMPIDIEKGIKVIGLMSGTSLDGLDICYVNFRYERNGDDGAGKWHYEIIKAGVEGEVGQCPEYECSGLCFASL